MEYRELLDNIIEAAKEEKEEDQDLCEFVLDEFNNELIYAEDIAELIGEYLATEFFEAKEKNISVNDILLEITDSLLCDVQNTLQVA